jgi:hypothetical protein
VIGEIILAYPFSSVVQQLFSCCADDFILLFDLEVARNYLRCETVNERVHAMYYVHY